MRCSQSEAISCVVVRLIHEQDDVWVCFRFGLVLRGNFRGIESTNNAFDTPSSLPCPNPSDFVVPIEFTGPEHPATLNNREGLGAYGLRVDVWCQTRLRARDGSRPRSHVQGLCWLVGMYMCASVRARRGAPSGTL